MRLGRRCLRYLAQIAIHENADSANKRNHDDSVLRHNYALLALFFPR